MIEEGFNLGSDKYMEVRINNLVNDKGDDFMLVEAIEKILSLGTSEKLEKYGLEYRDKAFTPILPLSSQSLQIGSIQGLIDWINANAIEDSFILIKKFNEIYLLRPKNFLENSIQYFEIIECKSEISQFRFDDYCSLDVFMTKIMSQFQDTPDKFELLNILSKIKKEDSNLIEDNGITQKVTVKSGVALIETKQIKNPLVLAPYRAFPEVKQPESNILLRVNSQTMNFALFEADAGAWKYKLIQIIKEFIKVNIKKEILIIG